MSATQSDEVIRHYRELSAGYVHRANRHADERYRQECLALLGRCEHVLDAGCGTGHFMTTLRPRVPVIGVDVSLAMAASGPARGVVAASALGCLPFGEGSFDGVICINVLEHVADPAAALREISRTLVVGGRVVVSTPAAEWSRLLDLAERLHLKIPEGPHRFLAAPELLAAAAAAGLEPELLRRILPIPLGGRRCVSLGRLTERLVSGGFQHWLVARRTG